MKKIVIIYLFIIALAGIREAYSQCDSIKGYVRYYDYDSTKLDPKCIKSLWIGGEPFDTSIIKTFVNLKKIRISGKRTTVFFKIAWQLNSLEKVIIFMGDSMIPPEIGKCKSLKEIEIRGTPIKEFPPEFCKLKNLERIIIANSNLEKLPHDFGNLQSLEYIYISWSKITTLPESFFKLKNLKCYCILGEEWEIPIDSETLDKLKKLLPNAKFDCNF